MINERAWPAKAMYFLFAAALAISLLVVAVPLQSTSADCTADVCAEWDMVDTPTMDGFVLAPESVIYDFAVASGGEVVYVVVEAYDDTCDDGCWVDADFPRALKSDDYGATWSEITDALENVIDTDSGDYIEELLRIETDGEDPDFVAVPVWWWDQSAGSYYMNVFFSTDGGGTFEDAGEVQDGGLTLDYGQPNYGLSDIEVSTEVGGKRDIAVIGMAYTPFGAGVFRCTVTGDSASAWEDATAYDGWDNWWTGDANAANDIYSWIVTEGEFSPNWATDKTFLVTTVAMGAPYDVYVQCASFGTSEGWNEKSSLGFEAVLLVDSVNMPTYLLGWDARGLASLTLPEDYNGKNSGERIFWAWVNYYDLGEPMCSIMRVDDDSADPVGPMGQIEDGELWLTNVSYHGTIAEGEAIAGVLGTGTDNGGSMEDLITPCCEGVQVYRNDGIRNMDICCERWHDACKPPTGRSPMAVWYVDDDKAYAVAMQGFLDYDEGAFSVTFDDGDTWNQLSLIDTYISYVSDVAVSPDCNKTFIATVNEDNWWTDYPGPDPGAAPWECYIAYDIGGGYYDIRWLYCDSVWMTAEDLPEAEEYSGQWLRTWCGILEGINDDDSLGHDDFPGVPERGLLRLDPEDLYGETVFLVDRMSGNVYQNFMETLACWDPIASTEVDDIVDLVAQDADTLFALGWTGDVVMFDDDEWTEPVDSELEYGWSIVVHGDHILVGGQEGDVSYTDDFDPDAEEDVFTELEKVYDDNNVYVNLAFDSYFDQNDTIYAALAHAYEGNGIYILVIGGETEDWTKLAAESYDYTGIVMDRPSPGNPMTSPETGGVLYASYQTWWEECDECCHNDYYEGPADHCWHAGVARCLEPIIEICCGSGHSEWSYLTWGLDYDVYFGMQPQALKICGCLSADTNSHLFAIDWDDYDMCDHDYGALWMFEDCYAKKGVEVTSPEDGAVIKSSVCEWCANVPFKIEWDRLCDACCYEIQFALDEDFTDLYTPWADSDPCGGGDSEVYDCCNPDWICPDTPTDPSFWMDDIFASETTYYWRMRAVEAETCQDITSWWSEPRSFTVAPDPEVGAISLISPEPGATDAAVDGLGFSWNTWAEVDSFDWVLDNNSDFSSPVESKTGLTDTAYGCTQTLSYDTSYYWQVTAYRDGSEIGKSAVGTFRTILEPEEDEEPVTPGTPAWVWVVIGIGAALVIVIIVLIFRTRRV